MTDLLALQTTIARAKAAGATTIPVDLASLDRLIRESTRYRRLVGPRPRPVILQREEW